MRPPLTDEQKRAATSPADRVFIEASPGSGKTTVATERYGVSRFGLTTDGRGVLALSFARSARGELHERVRQRWGANAMRWPHKVWTLDHLHWAIVQHLIGSGAIEWPGGCTELQVVDSWKGHKKSRWREAGGYRVGLYVQNGKVKIGGGEVGPAAQAFTAGVPYREHLQNGLCTHTEIRSVLASAITKNSTLQAVVTEFLTGTISSLIVDEVFDGNGLDLSIVAGAANGGVPTTLIGDPWQALYAFRGAQPAHVPTLVTSLKFDPCPISQSFRFKTTAMQGLAANLRAGQPVTIPSGQASDCDVVLASEWLRLWACSTDVLPFSFGRPSNRIDAAIALLVDQVVTQRFDAVSTFGSDAAVLLGLDPHVMRTAGPAQFSPVLAALAGGTDNDAQAALTLLRTTLRDMGSVNITNLTPAKMADRHGRLVRLAQRLEKPDVIPGLTVHQAKGREWRRVGVLLTSGEHQRLMAGLSQDSETDRLLYVGLTRAREVTTDLPGAA